MKNKLVLLFVVIAFIIATFMHFMSNNSLIQIVGESVKNGNVQVLTKNLDVKVSDDVINIKIPNNCFYKKTELKLKAPKGEQLTVKFASPKVSETKTTGIFRKIQPRRKYIDDGRINVAYKSVKINGKNIKKQKFKTAKKSYDRHITSDKNGEINILFKHKLVPDYRLDVQPHVYLLLFVLLVAFLSEKYKDRDWLKCVVDGYKSIDPVYRKSFWIIFIVTNIVFSFHTFHLMYGNHSVLRTIFRNVAWDSYISVGRYSATLIKVLFFNGETIPILTNLSVFFAIAFSAILLCKYWKFSKSLVVYSVCGLLFALSPHTVEWLFYLEAQPDIAFAPLIVLVGFILAEESFRCSTKNKIMLNCLAIICLNFALSVYPTLLSTIAVIFAGRIAVEMINFDGSWNKFNNVLLKQKYIFLDIITSCLLFKLVLFILKFVGILQDFYTIRPLPLSQLPIRFFTCIKISFEKLYNYQFPFIPNCITEMFAILLIILIFLILLKCYNTESFKDKIKIKSCILFFLLVVLISTQVSVIVCDSPMFFESRMDYFGILYFKVLVVGILLTQNYDRNIKNFVTLICAGILFVSVVNDLLALKVWYLGFQAEQMSWNRILVELENNKNFNPNKKYCIVGVGANYSYRQQYYKIPLKTANCPALLGYSIMAEWQPLAVVSYYYKEYFIFKFYRYKGKTEGINTAQDWYKIIKLYNTGVLLEALKTANKQIWVKDDFILYVADKSVLKELIKEIENRIVNMNLER